MSRSEAEKYYINQFNNQDFETRKLNDNHYLTTRINDLRMDKERVKRNYQRQMREINRLIDSIQADLGRSFESEVRESLANTHKLSEELRNL